MHINSNQKQPIFILGSPRSGTTLLQRLLNSYKDTLIWGEHAQFLRDLSSAFYKVWSQPSIWRNQKLWQKKLTTNKENRSLQAWMNSFDRRRWIQHFKDFLDNIFLIQKLPDKRYWGFKEVKYLFDVNDRTIEFLYKLYPKAIFVFVIRNGFDVLASIRKRVSGVSSYFDIEFLCSRWKTQNLLFRKWHRSGKIQSFWICYGDLIRAHGEFIRLLKTVGKCLGGDQHAILKSEKGRGSSFSDASYHDRWKTLPQNWLDIAYQCFGGVNKKFGFKNPPVAFYASKNKGELSDNHCFTIQNGMIKRMRDKTVLWNLKNGDYYVLNKSALFIFKLLKRKKSILEIIDDLRVHFKISKEQARKDVFAVLRKFNQTSFLKKAVSLHEI